LICKNHGDFFTWFNTGWWLTYPSEKYSMGRIIPYIMENKSHVWKHPPDHDLTDWTHQISCSFMDLWALPGLRGFVHNTMGWLLPSGKHTKNHWKWPWK
jgi:hypothetical protein